MVVIVEKSLGPVDRIDWGDGKKKIEVPTDILCQWRASPPKPAIPLDLAPTKKFLPQGRFKIGNIHPHPNL